MKIKKFMGSLLIISLFTGFLVTVSCDKIDDFSSLDANLQEQRTQVKKASASFSENFEAATKTSYTAAAVTFSTGQWYLSDALIGTSSSDRKNDSKSVRVRNTGTVTMQFDKEDGAGTVEIYHALYGSDGTSTWELYMSTNSGSSWTQVGSTITTSSTTLTKASFTVNVSGNVRFEIRKVSGGSYRINFDDLSITDYSTSTTTTTTGAFPETFESGTKTSYTAAAVTLSTGNWYFDNALIGTSSSDRKDGSQSARIRSTGIITMQFDKENGAGTVTVSHAKYGSDGTSTWELYMSTNSGSSWSQVGSTITTSSTTLSSTEFTVNQSGNVRFEIRKITGTSYRINIDNFSITDYTSGDTGGDTGDDTGDTGGTTTSGTDGDHIALGNPSGAVANILYANNYLMVKPQYVLSYNNSKLTCNWVSWYLASTWLGSASRQNDFRADATLPSNWVQVGSTDYSGSGFDRGHMCPSADRTSTTTDNSATFLMTNMVPQAPKNNQVTWANLENYCRSLVSAGNELYIISGPYGQGGTGSNGYYTTVSSKNIVVPSYVWKIIVVLPVGTNDVSRITSSTRVIAVWMPNTQTVSSQAWGYYRTTVDYIESMTGYDFLSNVSTTIQAAIESTVDTGATS